MYKSFVVISLKRIICFGFVLGFLSSCETTQPPLVGERISIFEQKEVVNEGIAKIVLDRPYVNEAWTSSLGNPVNAKGHLAGKKSFLKFASNDIGTVSAKNQILYSPVANKDTVFTIDGELKVVATSLEDGSTLWENDALSDKSVIKYGALALSEEKLYVMTNNSQLLALNPLNGKVLFSKWFNTSLKSGLQICGDKLFFIDDTNELYVVDTKKDDKLWTHKTMEENASFIKGATPVCVNDKLVAAFSNGEVHMVMVETGTPIWLDVVSKINRNNTHNMSDIVASPVVSGELVIVKSYNNLAKAFDISTGKEMWDLPIGGISTPAVSGNFMFDVDSNKVLSAIDTTNGTVIWTTKLNPTDKDAIVFDPLVVNNQLMISFSNGEIIKINPYTGEFISLEEIASKIDVTPIIIEDKFIILSDANLIIFK